MTGTQKPLLQRRKQELKKIPSVIALCGAVDPEFVQRLKAAVPFTRTVAMESMQIEEAREHQAIMNLFVVKPKQTGLVATAEMTAQAIKNPEKTAVYVMHGDDGAVEAPPVDTDRLVEVLASEGAEVMEDFDTVANKLNHFMDETGSLEFYEEIPPALS